MSDRALPQRIVCGVSCREPEKDGRITIAETDLHTTEQAIDLAARCEGSIVFVHVVDWVERRAIESDEIIAAVDEALGEEFAALTRKAEARGVSARHETRLGRPGRELLNVADEVQADVVVVSPRRERISLGKRIFHGHTAYRVLKESRCPVWVVEPDCPPPRRILALLDRTDVSQKVVEAAEALAGIYDSKLFGLCCLEYPNDMSLQRMPRARNAIQRYHQEVRETARNDLDELTARNPDWSLLLGEDWVVRLAPRVIEEKKIDLVVMGGVSKPRLAGALLGTTAQRLLDHMSVSVWMVRGEAE